MKSIFLMISLVAITVSSQGALANMVDQTTQDTTTQNAQPQNVQTQNPQSQSESALLGWLVVLNKTEVAVSKEVLTRKNLNPLVKGYAQFMVSQHTLLLNDAMKVSEKMKITPDESAEAAAALQKDGDDGLAKLKGLDDKAINKGYIDAMVQGHTQALAALAGYIKDEKNPMMKALLKVTEMHVAVHLKKAQAIQKKLGS